LETSLSKQSLALVLITQNKQKRENIPKQTTWAYISITCKNTQNTLTQPKPAGHTTPVITAHMCVLITVCNCGTLPYTTQHRTDLIIFPLILQTITTAQMMSTGMDSEAVNNHKKTLSAKILA